MTQPRPLWRPLRCAGVLALLLLGSCLIVPNVYPWRRHRCGNECAAIGALKSIANAQTLFREGDKDHNDTLEYAANLESLVNTGSSRQEDLIDEVLAGGTKQGYAFEITSSSEFVWTASANPVVPGTTGDRYFGANMAGLIFYSYERPVRFAADGSSTDPVLGQ